MKFIPRPLVETADISRGKASRRTLLKDAFSATLVLAALYFLLGAMAEGLARTLPDRWERKFAPVITAAAGNRSNELERAQAILNRLTDGEPLRQLDYSLFVINLDAPNAVAVPGGGIGVTHALLDTVETEAGLAFVLAHELGHHQNRHILRGMGRTLILTVTASLLFSYDGLSSFDSALRLAESGHSRRQERVADEFALGLVRKKYGTTAGALEFFEKLVEADHDSFWQKYGGSHPLTRDRLESMRAMARQLDTPEP